MYEELKQEINENINENGAGEITGSKLNGVLTDIVDAVADDVQRIDSELWNVFIIEDYDHASEEEYRQIVANIKLGKPTVIIKKPARIGEFVQYFYTFLQFEDTQFSFSSNVFYDVSNERAYFYTFELSVESPGNVHMIKNSIIYLTTQQS